MNVCVWKAIQLITNRKMSFVVGKDASTLLMEPNKNPNELLMELDKLVLTFIWKNKKRVKRETSE